MEIKDQSTETATDAQGHEYIAESHQTVTDTSADGTTSVAEMTVTANPDDPTEVEGEMTITATAPDGTETVTNFVANDEGVFQVEEESVFEQAVENIFGIEIEDDLTKVMDADGNPVNQNAEGEEVYSAEAETDNYLDETDSEIYSADTDSDAESVEFDSEGADYAQSSDTFEAQSENLVSDSAVAEPSFDTFAAEGATYNPTFSADNEYSAVAETDENVLNAEENQQIAEQEAHTNAATDAQAQADEFIAKGDYAAAADARETAENEAWEAGDDSMLSAYDAQDLSYAAEKQEDAKHYEAQQAEHAQSGDYEAAREDANNAAYATYNADSTAGGDDHTGQADAEKYEMDWAVSEENRRIITRKVPMLTQQTAIWTTPKFMPPLLPIINLRRIITAIWANTAARWRFMMRRPSLTRAELTIPPTIRISPTRRLTRVMIRERTMFKF